MKALLIALALAHGADTATTVMGIQAGAYEANPLLPQHPAGIVSVTAAATVGKMYLLNALERDKPRLARVLGWIVVGVECGAAANNIRVRIVLGNQRR